MYPEFYGKNEVKKVNIDYEVELDNYKNSKEIQVHEWMQKPAMKQVHELKKDTAYVEGNYDYNIWYDKYLTDRNANKEEERPVSMYKCKPEVDTGYTKADKIEGKGTYFCNYFARGCCVEGVNCRFYHRVP